MTHKEIEEDTKRSISNRLTRNAKKGSVDIKELVDILYELGAK